jgi:hypothetical protein
MKKIMIIMIKIMIIMKKIMIIIMVKIIIKVKLNKYKSSGKHNHNNNVLYYFSNAVKCDIIV